MFDLDKWQEIFSTIRKNKLRTILTGFSIASGIFMLILLLGAGRGLKNGVSKNFRGQAQNSIMIYRGTTSKPYKGLPEGRRIRFTNEDYDFTLKNVKNIKHSSARSYTSGQNIITYKNESGAYQMRNVHPGFLHLRNLIISEGRFINQKDLDEARKVVVLGKNVKEGLFKTKNPIGEYVEINNVPHKVIGVFTQENVNSNFDEVYLIPITTAQNVFGGKRNIFEIGFTTEATTVFESKKIAENLRRKFALRHKFDVTDKQAIYIRNNIENAQEFNQVFGAIETGIWVIGIFTIILGMVGVVNIMMIVVKERTKEIGVRKAIGARPSSIISLIIQESVFITTISGYIGLIAGIGLLELVANYGLLEKLYPPIANFYLNPEVDLGIAITATIVLIIAGAIGGLIPARKAARIKPIDALRDE